MDALVSLDALKLYRPVVVDIDGIRDLFPEAESMKLMHPERFGERTQKEAGLIAELTIYQAISQGRNVILDSSLRDISWFKEFIPKLTKFSKLGGREGVNFALVHVYCPREECWKRILQRNAATGSLSRVVSPSTFEKSLNVRKPVFYHFDRLLM